MHGNNFFEKDQFGNRLSPPPGAGIISDKQPADILSAQMTKLQHRFVISPTRDIDLITSDLHQPLFQRYFYRMRLVCIKPVTYQTVDNSAETFLIDSKGTPMKTLVCTPFAQCIYLYESYAHEGLRVLEDITGMDEQMIAQIEAIILPEVPPTLKKTLDYLLRHSEENIRRAGLDSNSRQIAEYVLSEFIQACRSAVSYISESIREFEGLFAAAQRGDKNGKPIADRRDRYHYSMLEKPMPREDVLQYQSSGGDSSASVIRDFVTELRASVNSGPVPSEAGGGSEIERMREELQRTQAQVTALLETLAHNRVTPTAAIADVPVVEKTFEEEADELDDAFNPVTAEMSHNLSDQIVAFEETAQDVFDDLGDTDGEVAEGDSDEAPKRKRLLSYTTNRKAARKFNRGR